MILSVVHDHEWKHASTPYEMERLLYSVVFEADPRYPSALMLADWPIDDDVIEYPETHIRCCANPEVGLAALVYMASDLDPDRMWVTFNAEPPLDDPQLASDLDTFRYHDRFTAIPIGQARQALSEFCRTGGKRPECVQWVRGDYYGRITEPLVPRAAVRV
jgi:hypothetical protein